MWDLRRRLKVVQLSPLSSNPSLPLLQAEDWLFHNKLTVTQQVVENKTATTDAYIRGTADVRKQTDGLTSQEPTWVLSI